MTAASPVRTPARAWRSGCSGLDRVDELERGADGALGVVLVGDRRAPDRHDRVADELLDRPAVQLHDLGRGLEVAAEELADRLGVAVLGDVVKPTRSVKRTVTRRRSASAVGGRRSGPGAAAASCRERVAAARAERASDRFGSPQCGQVAASAGCRSCRRTCCRPGSRCRSRADHAGRVLDGDNDDRRSGMAGASGTGGDTTGVGPCAGRVDRDQAREGGSLGHQLSGSSLVPALSGRAAPADRAPSAPTPRGRGRAPGRTSRPSCGCRRRAR